ncbi:DUF397 domain-containing protein [Streptomyces sp. NPDC004838]
MQSRTPVIPAESWFKSSYSGANTSECVEAAALDSGALVRDSKTPLGPVLPFAAPAWVTFVTALKDSHLG